MKKIYLILFVLVSIQQLEAQNPEISTGLPTIIPPSPTVAALMRFEEVPVSNYTGIPNISIPLYTCPTRSKDITLNISLNYHISGIAADERASNVGLGWSLFAGGTISRTVRGIPDEMIKMGAKAKIGIYQDSITNFKNDYYHIVDVLADGNTSEFDVLDEALWNAQVRGSHDTEHDLWQFNFMGMSGRFFIQKDSLDHLNVMPLDDYRLKIVNRHGITGNKYTPTSFEIFDEKGYKYVFDVKEVTTSSASTFSQNRMDSEEESSISADIIATSAFQLSKVYDNNDNLLIEFLYDDTPMEERVIDKTLTNYSEAMPPNPIIIRDFNISGPCQDNLHNFNPYPFYLLSVNQRSTMVKNLQQIKIRDIAKINFNYSQGREDSNYELRDSAYVFKGIVIKDWNDHEIKKVELTQNYLTTIETRMILDKVSFQNFEDTKKEEYQLFYKTNNNPYERIVNKDYWGYFNLRPLPEIGGFYREVTPGFCDSEILQKMTIPTGGCIIYDFEPNTFAYIGSTELPNYDANPENWTPQTSTKVFTSNPGSAVTFFTIASAQTVAFETTMNISDTGWMFNLYKLPDLVHPIGSFSYDNCNTQDCVFSFHDLPAGDYKIGFFDANTSMPSFIATIKAYYKVDSGANKKYVFGGGNRIKRIGYFADVETQQEFYQNGLTSQPEKEMNYSYNILSNGFIKSSGSLAFEVPKYEYMKGKEECVYCTGNLGMISSRAEVSFYYNLLTTFNNYNPIKTQGADIGYKNVKVYEQNNGYTQFEYSTAFDFPETMDVLNLSPPFLPTKNFDYKRGLLKSEKKFNQSGDIFNEVIYKYEYDEYIQRTGFRTYYYNSDFINLYNHIYFIDYKNYIKTCYQYETNATFPIEECNNLQFTMDPLDQCICWCYFGKVREFTAYSFIDEAYGWAKLKSKTTKNYFYPSGSSTANVIQTDETYKYNPVNKKIKESSITNSKGELLRTKYFYHNGDAVTRNRISEIERIETYKDSTLLSKSEIFYHNNFSGNSSYLPNFIRTAKDTQALEKRIEYTDYDKYGHPLEVKQEDGTPVSYVWGYNKSQPIAKIENCSYSSIPATLITAAQAASDTGSGLVAALNELRAGVPSSAMITTYTYKPLVGVSTITDPKGYTTTYEYDSFGRLSAVKDAAGNKLSENEYHYKN